MSRLLYTNGRSRASRFLPAPHLISESLLDLHGDDRIDGLSEAVVAGHVIAACRGALRGGRPYFSDNLPKVAKPLSVIDSSFAR